MKVLIVEDGPDRMEIFYELFRQDEVRHAPTADWAKYLLSKDNYDLVMLDHDLNDVHLGDPEGVHEGTGQDVAKFMVEMYNPPPFAFIHSWNPDGAKAIANILDEVGINNYTAAFNTIRLNDGIKEYRRKFEKINN